VPVLDYWYGSAISYYEAFSRLSYARISLFGMFKLGTRVAYVE
jgi:hypothetical protein